MSIGGAFLALGSHRLMLLFAVAEQDLENWRQAGVYGQNAANLLGLLGTGSGRYTGLDIGPERAE